MFMEDGFFAIYKKARAPLIKLVISMALTWINKESIKTKPKPYSYMVHMKPVITRISVKWNYQQTKKP